MAVGELLAGRVAGAHGIRGEIKLRYHTESPDVFIPGLILFIGEGDARRRMTVKSARPHGPGLLVALEGVDTRNDAETLAGSDVFIDAAALPEITDADTFYWKDLIGLTVVTGEGEDLGRLEHIFQTGGNDVYVVKKGRNELLIPALVSVVRNVDLSQGRMTVDLPEGLR